MRIYFFIITLLLLSANELLYAQRPKGSRGMLLNKQEYLSYQGVDVMLAQDFYPEGHQGGVGVIQNGQRVATNGDLRLEPTPGQWSPIPKVGKRVINAATGEISVRMEYPNEAIDRKGFNPIIYPDLKFAYNIRVIPAGKAFKIIVDLDKPLPDAWIGKVGFNFELYPGILFGKTWYMDSYAGIFPRQGNDQDYKDGQGELQVTPMASGKILAVAPESDRQRMIIRNLGSGNLQLIDGRSKYNNGWFVVRSLIAKGAAKNAIEWLVSPNAIEGWLSDPVVQVSQVGYHPDQKKTAVIELDHNDVKRLPVSLLRINESGGFEKMPAGSTIEWGDFLRYHYLQFDFSSVKKPGMYVVAYGKYKSSPFKIAAGVYSTNVWQPTLEYFLPVQMCHMQVRDHYRIWHGWCHMDDARMALTDSNHFDGYIQGHSTLNKYASGQTVPALNRGGWHDAGDFDLRIESQAETVHGLTMAYEQFGINYDNTTVNQADQTVQIQVPDGKPDVLQQIEHGLLTITGSYRSMGRFYRGIIEPALDQYVTLGDPANITNNIPYKAGEKQSPATPPDFKNVPDDRWVFTEDNPQRSLETAAALAAATRVMKGYNDTLSAQCLSIATSVWNNTVEKEKLSRVPLAVELLVTTGDKQYADFLTSNIKLLTGNIEQTGWLLGRTLNLVNTQSYREQITAAVQKLYQQVNMDGKKTPYSVPYEPNIWGAGWGIQNFGYRQYFLYKYFPQIFTDDYMLSALNFVLGCHPGSNTASFVSGVGARSMTTAYGFNRADWSYIPGGITSGTALIRPDFPELLNWPFLWQQGEYVLGGGTTDYLFLVLAADHILNKK